MRSHKGSHKGSHKDVVSHKDVIIVGGSLTASLTRLKLAVARPDLSVLLLAEDDLGGPQTHGFFESDVPTEALSWIRPLATGHWPECRTRFPRTERTIKVPYYAFRGDDLKQALLLAVNEDRWHDSIITGQRVRRLTESEVILENGATFTAKCVLDARDFNGELGDSGAPGPKTRISTAAKTERSEPSETGYLKYLGFEFEMSTSHGANSPLLIDATCPQLDGLRYYEVLPWTSTRLLIREVFYSDTPALNRERLLLSVQGYAERQGWSIKELVREEIQVLPLPLTSRYLVTNTTGQALQIGSKAGYYHAVTGQCLPDAVRFAEFIAALPELSTQIARERWLKSRRPWVSRQRFYCLLNRLIFVASEPLLRYLILQKFFHELSDDTIQRFFAERTSWSDRLRVLNGKSPVPFRRVLRHFSEKTARKKAAPPGRASL